MADQDQVPQNSIPPKASPFAKPEGAAPAVPGAPRPITVRLKPVAPAAAVVVPPAATVPQDISPRVTARVNLGDLDVAGAPQSASPRVTARVSLVDGDGTPAVMPQNANPRVTARVNLADLEVPTEMPPSATAPIAAAPAPAITPAVVPSAIKPATAPATVRLRPVAPPSAAGAPAITPAAAPAMTPAAATHPPQHPPTPGSNPLPDGPKPSSSVQLQAAKSKTSRISLDSAIGVAPMAPMTADKNEPKTIRLKRPTDLGVPAPAPTKTPTAPIRQTSRIPDAALPTESADSAAVTQKKTLKIKRPGAAKDEASVSEGASSEAFPEGVQLTPLAALEAEAPQEPSSVFTALAAVAALAALFVVAALTYCLAAQAVAPVADNNTFASISGPDLPWVGKLSE